MLAALRRIGECAIECRDKACGKRFGVVGGHDQRGIQATHRVGRPPQSVTTAGRPVARDSSAISPKPSRATDGTTVKSASV